MSATESVKPADRRDFLKYGVTAIVCGVVAGVGGYFGGTAAVPAPVEKTVTKTEATTVTKTVAEGVPAAGMEVPLEKVIFTRTGAALFLEESMAVSTVKVFDATRTTVCSQGINKEVDLALVDFTWSPSEKYRLEVSTAGGDLLSSTLYAPTKPSLSNLGTFEVPNVPAGHRRYTPSHFMGNPPGEVDISPDGRYAALVTSPEGTDYTLFLLDAETREELWRKANIRDVEFSADSKYLVGSIYGSDAYLCCLSVEDGAEIWRYRGADDVGEGERSPRSWPGISMGGPDVDANNRAYIGVNRMWVEYLEEEGVKKAHNYFATKYYCFDIPSGEILWTYPEDGTVDRMPADLQCSEDGKYVLISTGHHYGDRTHNEGTMFCLDGRSGSELWQFSIQPAFWFGSADGSFDHVLMSSELSDDGKYAIGMAYEGRAFVFDNEKMVETHGETGLLWHKNIAEPLMVDGAPIYATVYAEADCTDAKGQRYIIFHSGNYFSGEIGGERSEAPVEPPYSHCLWLYSLDGTLLSRYRYEGHSDTTGFDLSDDGRYFAVGVRQTLISDNTANFAPRNTETHGVYIFDLHREGCFTNKLDWFYHTEGSVLDIEFSPDGKYVVVVEGPLDISLVQGVEDIIGALRFHFLT